MTQIRVASDGWAPGARLWSATRVHFPPDSRIWLTARVVASGAAADRRDTAGRVRLRALHDVPRQGFQPSYGACLFDSTSTSPAC